MGHDKAMGSKQKRTRMALTALLTALAVLVVLISGNSLVYASSDAYVKVGLKYGSTAVNSCTLKSPSGFQIVNVQGDRMEETLPVSAYTSITASVENGAVVLRDTDSGSLISSSMGQDDCIMPMDYLDEGIITCDGTKYRDGIQFLVAGGDKLTVINYISMEHYLYGVLPGEMGTGFPLEALKAQAVAARSFTQVNLSTHRSSGFEVCSTVHCQMYKAYAGENEKTNQAVDETSGLILYADGEPAAGYYYKNSGGYTQNSEDVWSAKVSYLRAVKDIYSPDYPWTATMSFSQLASYLDNTNNGVGTVKSIAVTARNESGAVAELTVVGSSGTKVFTKEKARTAVGGAYLKSTQYYLTDGSGGTGAAGNTANSEQDSIYMSNGSSRSVAGGSVSVLGASGGIQEKNLSDLYSWTGNASEKITSGNSAGTGTVSGNDGVITGGTVTFVGKGYGHGIGMAQDSALQMAQKGMDFEEILQFFYTGVKIK